MSQGNKGWVKLHRKFLDSLIFKSRSAVPTKVWVAILLSACHEAYPIQRSNGKEITLKPGEFAFGRNAWAKRLNISPGTLRNTLSTFRSRNQIIVKVSDMHTPSIYQITNWNLYQTQDKLSDMQPDNPPDTINNVNIKNVNDNKANKPNKYFSDPLKNEAYRRFILKIGLKRKNEAPPDKPINDLNAYCRTLAHSDLLAVFNEIFEPIHGILEYESLGSPYPYEYSKLENRLVNYPHELLKFAKASIKEQQEAEK